MPFALGLTVGARRARRRAAPAPGPHRRPDRGHGGGEPGRQRLPRHRVRRLGLGRARAASGDGSPCWRRRRWRPCSPSPCCTRRAGRSRSAGRRSSARWPSARWPSCCVPPQHHLVRTAAVMYGLAAILAFVVPTPLGANLTRLGMYAAAPVLLALVSLRRSLLVVALVGLWFWQWSPAFDAIVRSGRDLSTQRDYYVPLMRYLGSVGAADDRTEVVPTARHWEAAYVAAAFPIARGLGAPARHPLQPPLLRARAHGGRVPRLAAGRGRRPRGAARRAARRRRQAGGGAAGRRASRSSARCGRTRTGGCGRSSTRPVWSTARPRVVGIDAETIDLDVTGPGDVTRAGARLGVLAHRPGRVRRGDRRRLDRAAQPAARAAEAVPRRLPPREGRRRPLRDALTPASRQAVWRSGASMRTRSMRPWPRSTTWNPRLAPSSRSSDPAVARVHHDARDAAAWARATTSRPSAEGDAACRRHGAATATSSSAPPWPASGRLAAEVDAGEPDQLAVVDGRRGGSPGPSAASRRTRAADGRAAWSALRPNQRVSARRSSQNRATAPSRLGWPGAATTNGRSMPMQRSCRGDVTGLFRPCERRARRSSGDDDRGADRRERSTGTGRRRWPGAGSRRTGGCRARPRSCSRCRRCGGSGWRGSRSRRSPSSGSGSSAAGTPGRSTPSTSPSGCTPRARPAPRCRTCCPRRGTSG